MPNTFPPNVVPKMVAQNVDLKSLTSKVYFNRLILRAKNIIPSQSQKYKMGQTTLVPTRIVIPYLHP